MSRRNLVLLVALVGAIGFFMVQGHGSNPMAAIESTRTVARMEFREGLVGSASGVDVEVHRLLTALQQNLTHIYKQSESHSQSNHPCCLDGGELATFDKRISSLIASTALAKHVSQLGPQPTVEVCRHKVDSDTLNEAMPGDPNSCINPSEANDYLACRLGMPRHQQEQWIDSSICYPSFLSAQFGRQFPSASALSTVQSTVQSWLEAGTRVVSRLKESFGIWSHPDIGAEMWSSSSSGLESMPPHMNVDPLIGLTTTRSVPGNTQLTLTPTHHPEAAIGASKPLAQVNTNSAGVPTNRSGSYVFPASDMKVDARLFEPNRKSLVAVCLHGKVGSWGGKVGFGGSSINLALISRMSYERFILPFQNVTFFLHTQDLDLKSKLLQVYQPAKYMFEPQRTFDIPKLSTQERKQYHYDESRLKASFSRWYSAYRSLSLRAQYEKEQGFEFDFVMLTRYDVVWMHQVTFREVFDRRHFYCEHFGSRPSQRGEVPWMHVADFWFVSSSSVMTVVADLHLHQRRVVNDLRARHTIGWDSNHRMIYAWLESLKLEKLLSKPSRCCARAAMIRSMFEAGPCARFDIHKCVRSAKAKARTLIAPIIQDCVQDPRRCPRVD